MRLPVHVRVEHPADVRAASARGAWRFEVALRPGSLAEADYRIARIRARAGPRAALGIDASAAGWDVDEARRALPRLAAYAPAWVIDPVPPADLAALGPSPAPVVVDLRRARVPLAGLLELGAVGVVLPADAADEAARVGLRPFVVLGDPSRVLLPHDAVLLARGGPLDLLQGDLLAGAPARHLRS